MIKVKELVFSPEEAADQLKMQLSAAQQLHLDNSHIEYVRPVRRSIDARSKKVKVRIKAEVFIDEPAPEVPTPTMEYPNVESAQEVIIVGSGPAGLFAALRLIEQGFKPIVLERGKDVKNRRKDLSKLHRQHEVNPDSNYCFGEGGAGTYSDGKLYTRSKKRGDLDRILDILVAHGAVHDIKVDAHPHIGTNKLPKIVTAMRQSILAAGGEFHFDTRVSDFIVKEGAFKGVVTQKGDRIEAAATILATGHSARDIFELLHYHEILIEAKPFAMGVRIEHPQPIIDQAQYRCTTDRGKYLPAASYSLVQQVNNRGVYSFCMCPGGFIVPAATAPGEVVVNGMSTSTRDSRYANSGMVVAVEEKDLRPWLKHGPFAALELQKSVERMAFEAGNQDQTAPAQRMVDFVEGKLSPVLNSCSYIPGIKSAPLHEILPKSMGVRLQEAFKVFGKKMKGYYTNEAQILGVESRTSSPVKIPRDYHTLEHPQMKGLFPSGEGGGYAGGIVSAAIDGERVANAVAVRLREKS